MLEEVLRYLKNWFPVDAHGGTFTVENGSITLPFVKPGQYFRVFGSLFNDGVHRAGDTDMVDETWSGVVWALAVPPALLKIVSEMEAWQEKNGKIADGPYSSESLFGQMSYTKATDPATGWTVNVWSAFRNRLAEWRKI